MPIYDCGAPDCEECQKAFGPDRSKAVAEYESREKYYATLPQPHPVNATSRAATVSP